jgi:large subunit ribosomal protein L3
MPGHMGSEKVTTKNLEIVEVRIDQNLLLIKGSVPGSKGSYLEIKKGD